MDNLQQTNGKALTAMMDAKIESDDARREVFEDVLSLRDLLRVIWKRLWLILLVVVMLVGMAVGFSFTQTPTYEASIQILVGQERGAAQAPRENIQDLQRLTQTMAEAVNSRPVAEAVIRQEGLQMTPEDLLETSLSVQQTPETQFIEVTYRDSSPEKAQQIANAFGDVFSEQISDVSPSASAITATVWERAAIPEEPVSPNPVVNGLLALMLGLMLGVGLAFLLEYLDDSLRSPEEAEQISGVPTLGAIPEFKMAADKKKGGY